ncbi:Rab family GTPase [Histomonas meleagridis]|uniref:Rab family GTPase n=1 Tax=Histomonas meleagridis TaxID=135588 RepID=UPI00355AC9B2|nr:Rab family GTPase [Histomonas meleagridis]KAH0798431.1 Rab family GTPase [Histomonas meleagridis]
MSPEIVSKGSYSFKTDIWSLGCILYEMCTLQSVFPSESPRIFDRINEGKYVPIPPDRYSPEIYDLVKKMLSVDPTQRPTIYDILSKPFIQQRIHSLLKRGIIDPEFLKSEMDHTIFHGFTPMLDPPNDKFHMRILFVGYHCVGKTALIERFISGEFNAKTLATIAPTYYRKKMKVDSYLFDFEVCDTSSQNTYPNFKNMQINGVNAYVIIFSVCDRGSFNDIKKCYQEIIEMDKNAIVFLCGNQCDLKEKRTISINEGKNLAKALNIEHEYFETSALTGEKVDTMFDAIARKYLMQLKKNYDMKEEEPSLCTVY